MQYLNNRYKHYSDRACTQDRIRKRAKINGSATTAAAHTSLCSSDKERLERDRETTGERERGRERVGGDEAHARAHRAYIQNKRARIAARRVIAAPAGSRTMH